ncbi:hypothetical protein PLICRDRAFT_101892 [Plicaturopsis crispa FD-325 SS-3]|nr:hypothetical protein PLICRDRAFT_101892 [Plicaturopsis crispa FD-325 SS-3]
MSENTLPTSVFGGLLLKLAAILELTQRPEGTVSPQSRQALLQATNDFKNAMAQAKELANTLPGGELLIEEQEEVIDMLERLRDRKRFLAQFSTRTLSSSSIAGDLTKMDVDSTASTPMVVGE